MRRILCYLGFHDYHFVSHFMNEDNIMELEFVCSYCGDSVVYCDDEKVKIVEEGD